MTRIMALAALAALILATTLPASAARCPRDCRNVLRAAAKACRLECPKRKAGKACRAACGAALRAGTATCKGATDPAPPDCGGTSTTTTTAITTTSTGGTTTLPGGTTTTLPGNTTVTLTLENYLAWCSVSVDGGAASTAASRVLQFPKDTVVALSGDKANATFVFGYWVGTAGDTGPSHDTAMMTTVTMDADKTVQACCPFASSPNTPCPAP